MSSRSNHARNRPHCSGDSMHLAVMPDLPTSIWSFCVLQSSRAPRGVVDGGIVVLVGLIGLVVAFVSQCSLLLLLLAVAVVVAAAVVVVASVTPVKLPPACPGTTGIGATIQHPKIGHFSSDCMVPFVKIRHHIMNNRSIGAAPVPDTHWPVMRMGPPSAEQ